MVEFIYEISQRQVKADTLWERTVVQAKASSLQVAKEAADTASIIAITLMFFLQ